MTVAQWSTTPSSNATIIDAAYGDVHWEENQSPSSVNDSARSVMAHIKAFYDSITAGGTITGSTAGSDTTLTLDSADDVYINLDKAASGDACYITSKTNNALRWVLTFGSSAAEAGSDAGSDFALVPYKDAGTAHTSTFSITRATGAVTITTTGVNTANVIALSATASGTSAAIQGYADTTSAGAGSGVTGVSVNGTTYGIAGYYSGTAHWSFYGNGNGYLGGTLTEASDRKLKTDLQRIEGALDKVDALTGYTFNRIDLPGRQTGLIAQDVQAVLPEAVTDNDGTLGLSYGNLAGLLVEAIKELRAEVSALKERMP